MACLIRRTAILSVVHSHAFTYMSWKGVGFGFATGAAEQPAGGSVAEQPVHSFLLLLPPLEWQLE